MKKVFILCLFMLLFVHSASADIIRIPYAVSGSGWWTGLAVTNPSEQDIIIAIYATTEQGVEKLGSFFTVKAHCMRVDLLENFFTNGIPAARVHLRIGSLSGYPFKASMFVGNSIGFGFQCFDSQQQ